MRTEYAEDKRTESEKQFAELTDADFEGLKVKIPVKYDEVLTILFGPDYMTPPPPEERVAKHLDV